MSTEKREEPREDLDKIYRWNRDLSESRARLLATIYNQRLKSAVNDRKSRDRLDKLQGRMSRLTLLRRDELMRVYSNAKLRQRLTMSADPRKVPSKNDEPVEDTSSTLRVKKILVIDNTAFIEMQFPSSEPIADVEEENIVYPEGVIDRRPYQTIARYRKMVGDPTDFVLQPLQVGSEQTETLVLGLEKFAEDHGCRLIFDKEDRGFDESLFRAVGGEVDLGSIHLLANDSLLTAQFDLKVNLDFHKDLARSDEDLRKFVQDFCQAMTTALLCHNNDFRILSIHGMEKDEAITELKCGLTTPTFEETEEFARKLQTDAQSGFSKKTVLRHVIPEDYSYQWTSALKYLKLQRRDLEPRFNHDYRRYPPTVESRGGYPYHFPVGWYRYGLRVLDKYEGDQRWIGQVNGPREWAVAYHGTQAGAASGIVNKGLLTEKMSTDAMRGEAIQQMGKDAAHPGVYVATHCDGGAAGYSKPFTVAPFPDKSRTFSMVFQCRVKPERFTSHTTPVTVGQAWRFVDSSFIRPYGLLLKE